LQQIAPVQTLFEFSLHFLCQKIGKFHYSIFVIYDFIINKNNYIKFIAICSPKTPCATHKKLLHCSKDYEKISSTLNGVTHQRIQVIPLLTSVSSTLLHWSGFKRNPARVAFFLPVPVPVPMPRMAPRGGNGGHRHGGTEVRLC
jgi:hypothetical protein